LNDIYLPLDDGSTTQIDHVVVSPFGVFVIETKTYKGWIFGNPRDAQWTQALHNGPQGARGESPSSPCQ
jgi:hypothetical protein